MYEVSGIESLVRSDSSTQSTKSVSQARFTHAIALPSLFGESSSMTLRAFCFRIHQTLCISVLSVVEEYLLIAAFKEGALSFDVGECLCDVIIANALSIIACPHLFKASSLS